MDIRQDQIELLYDAERLSESNDSLEDVTVVHEDDVESLRSALGHVLTEHHGIKQSTVSQMSVGALAEQFTPNKAEEETETLAVLSTDAMAQQPSTGGNPEPKKTEDDEPEDVRDLDGEARETIKSKLETASLMNERTPQYAEECRQEALSLAPDQYESVDDLREDL